MNNSKEVFGCPHCEGTGTCTVSDGRSCGTCINESKVKDAEIVRCDVCSGFGRTENKSERLVNRAPIIVLIVVLAAFYSYALFSIDDADRFNQMFPLIGSLTTMIVTFFFAKK